MERGRFGRPRRTWKDSVHLDFQEMGWGMDWIDLAQIRAR